MAEERLIDDDLDRNKKYKIRKNADGEDELYFDGEEEESGGYSAELYEIPAFSEDDGDAGVLTPEQIAEREESRRLAEENTRRYVEEHIAKAEEQFKSGDAEGALFNLNSARNVDGRCGKVYALKMKVLTRNFKDFSASDDCLSCSEGVRHYCTDEQKAELFALSGNLKKHIEKLEENAAALHVEVESKKAERREVYAKDRGTAIKWFSLTAVPFLVCLVLAVSFGSVMFAKQNGLNLILTIIFAALAVVLFVVTAFTSRKMWVAMKNYSLNEKNSSTRIGREYEEQLSEIKKLKTVLSSFSAGGDNQ